MNAIDLFCGVGGASRGLHDAGYSVHGFDHWAPAVECHNANGLPATVHDLSDPAGDHLVPYAPLWWASPPCQPFSAAGAGDGEFDGRDGFPWLLRLVALRRPDVLIAENVKGLTFAKHSGYFGGILAALRDLGYTVEWRVLNAADFGVPQTRERTIIVARRDGAPIYWPMPTHTEQPGMLTAQWVSMAEALGWNECEQITYHRGPWPVTTPAPPIHCNSETNMRRVMLRRRSSRDYRQNGRDGEPIRADLTGRPAPTVTTQAGGQWLLDTEQSQNAIRLTTAELAALQGFPPDWTWTGNKTALARMIGNACPPALVAAVAAANRPARMEAGT